jgi:aminoglycoside phosphotransferase family enzyme/predicted kinase
MRPETQMASESTSPLPFPLTGLLSPAAYPHAVTLPVRVAETHVSWVLLTGHWAYKIKKPLRLAFLDYSTLERRRRLCEEELRLNRRHAPGLYLGVSVITGDPAAPRVDGDGEAFEYAVRMRQFDAGEELPALIARGAVDAEALAGLGAALAHLHASAPPAPATADWGDPARVHRTTLANFDELRVLPEFTARESALAALEAGLETKYAAQHEVLRQRRSAGFIRECHGDLHCGNVVRWEGVLTPFDGLEFDPGLRWIDVVNDVAFLTMDLAERDRPELRRAALQGWCETLGDWAGLTLLPYYESYRALVRAKVASLAARQAPAGAARRAAVVAEALRYLDWAGARLAPRRGAMVLTCGLSGSGKTWLARAAAPAIGALHLRSDVERKRLAGLGPLEDSRSPPDAGLYTREFNTRTYDHLAACAESALRAGERLVVDAAFLRREERERFFALADRLGTAVVLLHCTAPAELREQRVARRAAAGTDASEAGPALLARQADWWEPFTPSELPRVVTVVTAQDTALADALAALARRLAV